MYSDQVFDLVNVHFVYCLLQKVLLVSSKCTAGRIRNEKHVLPLEVCRRDVVHIKCSNLSSDPFASPLWCDGG
jgi:hypothetical protein